MGFSSGDRVGDYRIVAPIDHGGTARIYLADRARSAGLCALKVVHAPPGTDPEFAYMLRDEAGILSRLSHPNVVSMVEIGETDDAYYLAMEYVHGGTLAKVLRGAQRRGLRLRPDLVAYIAMEVAAGLHAAHEAIGGDGRLLNVVHRDVSPQNVLLAREGSVKLIDFGIARSRGRSQSTGVMLKGKIQYMSPEQLDNARYDRRVDVYSLGVVIWEMLTGRPLFDGTTVLEIYDRIRTGLVPAPSLFAPDVPTAFEEVILAALSTNPDERPESAEELRLAIARSMPFAEAFDEADVAKVVYALLDDLGDQQAYELPFLVRTDDVLCGGDTVACDPAPMLAPAFDAAEVEAHLDVFLGSEPTPFEPMPAEPPGPDRSDDWTFESFCAPGDARDSTSIFDIDPTLLADARLEAAVDATMLADISLEEIDERHDSTDLIEGPPTPPPALEAAAPIAATPTRRSAAINLRFYATIAMAGLLVGSAVGLALI